MGEPIDNDFSNKIIEFSARNVAFLLQDMFREKVILSKNHDNGQPHYVHSFEIYEVPVQSGVKKSRVEFSTDTTNLITGKRYDVRFDSLEQISDCYIIDPKNLPKDQYNLTLELRLADQQDVSAQSQPKGTPNVKSNGPKYIVEMPFFDD